MSLSDDQRDSSEGNTTPRAKLYDISRTMKLVYRSAPAYSISTKYPDDYSRQWDRNSGSGPGSYLLPKVDCFKQRALQYTITSRRYAKFTSPLDDEYKQ